MHSKTTRRSSLASRVARASLAGFATIAATVGLSTGCLDRPVAEQQPRTTNIFVEQFRNTVIDKIDLLFMIDNSISMADKQTFFGEAVPELVGRLVNPVCVNTSNDDDRKEVAPGQPCGSGYEREFTPVKDIHIGVVTSSLGAYGGQTCSEPGKNDMAHLLGTVRTGITSYNNLGFLKWDPDNKAGGTTVAATLVTDFTNMVKASGEQGCGYEASLESWYRFLIDPYPFTELVQGADGVTRPRTDAAGNIEVDQAVLAQRKAFLRSNSLVSVVMLTDENDCSVAYPGLSWLVTHANRQKPLPRSTSACDDNPNDKCCRSCGSGDVSGCTPVASDESCKAFHNPETDPENLRCYEQKRRFGIDLLFPTSRYSVGLSRPQICPQSPWGDMDCQCQFAKEVLGVSECNVGTPIQNPLFQDLVTGAVAERDPSLVYLAAIVGVPWQDIATTDSLANPGLLRYMTAQQLTAENRWDTILGDIYKSKPPADAFMRESVAPRTGSNPITGDEMLGPDALTGNNINVHEYQVLKGDDLQYACSFPLATPRDCDAIPAGTGCDCDTDDEGENPTMTKNPLCGTAGNYGPDQIRAKAYPGLRHLDVLKRFGANSIVASICPKIVDPAQRQDPSYGYNPAVGAIVDRLKEALGGRCLPRRLVPDENQQVPCRVVEALPPDTNGCKFVENRGDTQTEDPELASAVRTELKRTAVCGGLGQTPCADICLFTIPQTTGDQQSNCQNSLDASGFSGYCYVDPAAGAGSEALVQTCPATQKRLLRFSSDAPQPGAVTFIACSGAAFNTGGGGEQMTEMMTPADGS
jgi:hypothetical protein